MGLTPELTEELAQEIRIELFAAPPRIATYFKAAFKPARAPLEVRERNVLRQTFVDGLSTEQIGARYDVHKMTAFRWLDAARDKLNKRTRNEFLQRVKVMPAELEAILRLVQSQLDLSLSRVL